MAKPVLSLKTKRPQNAPNCPQCEGWLIYRIAHNDMGCVKCDHAQPLEPVTVTHIEQPVEFEVVTIGPPEAYRVPADWIKGQLLNNRRNGDSYVLTLLAEEFDPQHPERALHFSNSFDCQAFVSWWYSRDNVDPRAG